MVDHLFSRTTLFGNRVYLMPLLRLIDMVSHFISASLHASSIPELPETTVREVSSILYDAVKRYYKANTRQGCTDPSSPNFHFQANLEDGSCKPPSTNLSFGGVYQTCTVDRELNTENLCTSGPNPAQQVNPLTSDFSCPEHYIPVKLHSGTVAHTIKGPVTKRVCKRCHLFKRCCTSYNVVQTFLSQATYEAYWCAALPGTTIPQNSGYLFGGVYTSTTANPVTGAKSCPEFFYSLHMGENIEVCVSNDYEKGYANSLPFAGFESCEKGNPLADALSNDYNSSNWPHTCPKGYSQHLVAVDEGCEVNFCIHTGAFNATKLLPARLPPFRNYPKSYKTNITNALVVTGSFGETWFKTEDGQWVVEKSSIQTGEGLLIALGDDSFIGPTPSSSDSSNDAAEIAIVSTILLGALVLLLAVVGRYAYKRYFKKSGYTAKRCSEYTELDDRHPSINASLSDSAETA